MVSSRNLLKKLLTVGYIASWLLALVPSAPAYATGESYHFQNSITAIVGTGGRIKGNAVFTKYVSDSSPNDYDAHFSDTSGCKIYAIIGAVPTTWNGTENVINPGGGKAVLSVVRGSDTNCSDGIIGQYTTNISIAPLVQTNAKVTVVANPITDNVKATSDPAVPKEDAFTLNIVTNVNDKEKLTPVADSGKTSPPRWTTDSITANPDGTYPGHLWYAVSFTGLTTATGGNLITYRACSKVAANCADFTFYDSADKTFTIDGKNKTLSGNGTTGSPTNGTVVPGCDAGSLTWLVCGAIDTLRSVVGDKLKAAVEDLLSVPAISVDTTSPLYKVWSAFRNTADVLLILVFFFIIFGTSLGIDNYTVKRVLPRLIAAAILIQFSYLIMGLLNDAVNVVSGGLSQLAANALNGSSSATTNASAFSLGIGATVTFVTGAAVVGIAAAAGAAVPILMAMVSAAIGLLTTVVTLEIRLMLIYFLIALSPLAIAAWILPNTESYYKLWKKNFAGMLIMYPLIALLFVAADMFNIITLSNQNSDTFQRLLASLAPLAVLFLVPMTFKTSSQLFNYAQSATKKIGGGASKQAQARIGKPLQELQKASAIQKLGSLNASNKQNSLAARLASSQAGLGFTRSAANTRKIQNTVAKDIEDRTKEEQTLLGNKNQAELLAGLEKARNKGDLAREAAHLRQLAKTPDGRKELAKIRSDESLGLNKEESERTDTQKRNARVWNQALAGDKESREALKGSPDIIQGASALDRLKLDDAENGTITRFADRLKANKKELDDHAQDYTDLKNIKSSNGTLNSDEQARYDNYRTLEDQVARGRGLINSAIGNPSSLDRDKVQLLRSSGVLTDEAGAAMDEKYDSNGDRKPGKPKGGTP